MSKEKMTMKALDAKIMKTISEIKDLKTRYAVLCKELTKLQREREKLEARTLYEAFKKSPKSFREVVDFPCLLETIPAR